MAVTANVLRISTTLRLGERVLVRCDDGFLATEYVLFDAADIVLRATDPVTTRETGYITTVRDALMRLAAAGITPDLAEETARAIAPEVVASFARTGNLRNIGTKLGACELFDGGVYAASSQTYEGAWLDLRALASAVPQRGASALLQALHLAAVLSEVAHSTPVHLSTWNATRDRRPAERTHRRVTLNDPQALPGLLQKIAPNPNPVDLDPQRDRIVREALLSRIRERASAGANFTLRAHLAALESALAMVETRSTGPLADPELWAIEQQLASGEAKGVRQRLDELERARGPTAAVRYLRARAALVEGDEPPSSVAQAMSAIANEDRGFHEAELVAARAWLAAGEEAYARHFARRLAEDATAPESERVMALEILDATSASAGSQPPPPVTSSGEPPRRPTRPGGSMWRERAVETHVGASLPPFATDPPPPFATDAHSPARSPAARVRYEPELVESLALPLGANEEILAVGDWPTTPMQVRTAMIRLARSLARDYRLWYGLTLSCNVLAVDAMQRHLAQRYAGAEPENAKVVAELQRHGALLSEILARSLGANWVDIAPTEPGYWAMLVPPATRCWPIGRVYRFVALGHSERDLVDYYVDIEARCKG